MGEGHGGLKLAQVDHHVRAYIGVGIGLIGGVGTVDPAVQVGPGHVVHGEDAVFGAGLNGHVGDARAGRPWTGRPPRPRQNSRRLVQGAVHADHADQVEDDILAADTGLELARQV